MTFVLVQIFNNNLLCSFNLQETGRLIAECRVRYLSFLGIGKNVKNCAFIMHTAQDKFVCYVFLCEPSSGALCKTIEAACKVSFPVFDVFSATSPSNSQCNNAFRISLPHSYVIKNVWTLIRRAGFHPTLVHQTKALVQQLKTL